MILSWDKPEKVMTTEEWQRISADSAPPGVYTPNMSREDMLRWKAKYVGGRNPQDRDRATAPGHQAAGSHTQRAAAGHRGTHDRAHVRERHRRLRGLGVRPDARGRGGSPVRAQHQATGGKAVTLTCVICLQARPGNPRKAETVANGHAVCLIHLPYVAAWSDLDTATKIAKGNEGIE